MQPELLAPGFILGGKYVVERMLGRGGMGAVYVVSHAATGKRMALKVLLPEFVHNADIVGRFMREAQIMGRLQHRHVVDVFDVGRDGDVLFIVMELLEGKPLGELVSDASLTLEETLVIATRAMEGVAAAHDVGVIHRDIKPDNIFVCVGPSGRLDDPRVLDFGISKLDGSAGQLTQSGVAMGTPYYMSIEQLNGQRDLDARVDVYAMGVILYEALAGRPPYTADSISALAIRVLTTDPVHLSQLVPELPRGLADVVMKAMAKQREQRYRSMRQLIEALRPFVSGAFAEVSGTPLRGPGVPTPAGRSVVQRVRANTRPGFTSSVVAKSALIALAILTLTGTLAYVAYRSSSEAASAVPARDARVVPRPPSIGMGANAPRAAQPSTDSLSDRATEQAAPRLVPTVQPMAPTVHSERAAELGRSQEHAARTSVSARPARADAPPKRAQREQAAPRAEARAAPEPSVEPAPPPAPSASRGSRKSAEGRAGKLGSDEF